MTEPMHRQDSAPKRTQASLSVRRKIQGQINRIAIDVWIFMRCAHINPRQYPYIRGKVTQTLPIQDEDPAMDWVAAVANRTGPHYLRITNAIERAIAEGQLRPGDRLPPQRGLAHLLGLDLTTVTRAYIEAKQRNLLSTRGALGTFVSTPTVKFAQLIDLSMNIPPPPAGLDFGDLLKQGIAQVLMHADVDLLMTYHPGGGSSADRAAGAIWLAPMLGTVDPALIVTCPGAQSALAALIIALTEPGDVIITEPLVYPGILTAARQLGRRVIAVDADDDGLSPAVLERACREHGARLIYLNPTLQNPTAQTMPEHRRRDIALVATRCGAQIIEDDPYWLLAADAPLPLAHFAPERAHYLSTLSKCLTPGLQTAYLLSPDTQSQTRFLQALRSITLMSTPLMTSVATQWIHDGSAARLLAGVKDESRARLELAEQMLPRPAGSSREGVHFWQVLPSHWTSQDLAEAARAEGLVVTSSEAFCAGANPPNAIRISLGGVKDRPRLTLALNKLAGLLGRQPATHQDVVI